MKKLISISNMLLVREWLNKNESRIERLYEGPNGLYVLWTGRIQSNDPGDAPVFQNETTRELTAGQVSEWYATASGGAQRGPGFQSYEDSPAK